MLNRVKLAKEDQPRINAVIQEGLSWQDINTFIPPLWQLRLQRLVSLLPLVSIPPAFYWQMRSFIKRESGDAIIFDINKLHDLLKIFHTCSGFEHKKLFLIQKITAAQASNLSLDTFQNILDLFIDDKDNRILATIITVINDNLLQLYFYKIIDELQHLLSKQQKEDPLRTKPVLSPQHIKQLKWCEHLAARFPTDDKKELLRLLHALVGNNCKLYTENLFSSKEIFKHLELIEQPDFYSNLWKDKIRLAAMDKVDFLFANLQLGTLLKVLDREDKYALFLKLLSHHSLDNRHKLLNNYFAFVNRTDQIYILNKVILAALENNQIKFSLSLLLTAEIPNFPISVFAHIAIKFLIGPTVYSLSPERLTQDFDNIITEVKLSTFQFSNDVNQFVFEYLGRVLDGKTMEDNMHVAKKTLGFLLR